MQHGFPIFQATRKMQQQLLFTVWLSLSIQWISGQAATDDVTALVGDTVILTAPKSEHAFVPIHWYRGSVPKLIFSYFVPTHSQTNGEAYTGRETGLLNGSLQIRDVQKGDTDNYTVSFGLQFNGIPVGPAVTATRQLRVYERTVQQETTTSAPLITYSDVSTPGIVLLLLVISFSVPVLAATALIVGVILYCKGRRHRNGILKGVTRFQNAASFSNLEGQYENWNGQPVPNTVPPMEAEPHYMDLKHGDQAVYDQL